MAHRGRFEPSKIVILPTKHTHRLPCGARADMRAIFTQTNQDLWGKMWGQYLTVFHNILFLIY